jgi:hypothetical protein
MNLRSNGRTYLHEYVTNLSLQGEHVSHNLLCTSDVGMCIQKAVQLQWNCSGKLSRCQCQIILDASNLRSRDVVLPH